MARDEMRKGRRRGVGGLLVLVIAAAAMSGSEAAVAQPLPAPGAFKLDASNGYSMRVLGAPAWRGRPAVVLVVVQGHAAQVIYSAPAEVTETSIQANLGELGEVDVSFKPSGRATRETSVCNDRSATFDSGLYEGVIDFEGEEGYTGVHAAHAKGDGQFALDLICSGPAGPSGSGPGVPGAELWVRQRPASDHLFFDAHKNRPGARAFFSARISEKHGGIAVDRSVDARGRSAAFEYDPLLQAARVNPPPPFSGQATFHRSAARASRWTGTLSVDFPGHSNVRLAPGALRAKLVRAEWNNSGKRGAYSKQVATALRR